MSLSCLVGVDESVPQPGGSRFIDYIEDRRRRGKAPLATVPNGVHTGAQPAKPYMTNFDGRLRTGCVLHVSCHLF